MVLRTTTFKILIITGVLLSSTLTTYANTAYRISPLVIDLDAEARDITTRTITITNTGTNPVTIYPTVNNISLGEGGIIKEFHSPVDSDRTSSLTSWIEFKRSGINLPIDGSATLELVFRINPNPVPGEYHAFLGFGNGRNQDEAVKQVRDGNAPGVVINVTIDDATSEFLKISKFFVNRFVTRLNNQAAVYTVRNPGDEVLVPTGEIIFYNNRGEEIGSTTVNPDALSIQPGEEHVFTAPVPTAGLFGKYKAFLDMEYGIQNRATIQDTSFFYVFPIKTILILFGVLAIVVVVIALFVHRRYFDDELLDDSDSIPLRIRETSSDPKHHDIDLSKSS